MSEKIIAAIIPARGGSKGIPGKNLKEIEDKPLVGITVETALQSGWINRVIVSSEDEKIRRVGGDFGAEVMDRPEEFIHDNTVQEVDRLLIHTVKEWENHHRRVIDIVVLLYPTAPLREVETVDRAIQMVVRENYDSVLSLVEDSSYLWETVGESGTVRPINYDPKTRGPRQKENWNQYVENKAVYVMTRDLLINTGCRLGGRIGYVPMSKLRSIDIDRPEDLELCRILYRRFNAQ